MEIIAPVYVQSVCVCVCDRGSRAAKWPQGRDVKGLHPRRMRSGSKRKSVESERPGCWVCAGRSSWWRHDWKRVPEDMAWTLTGTDRVIWRRGTQPLEKSWRTVGGWEGKVLNDWPCSGAPWLVTFKKHYKESLFLPLWVCKSVVSLVFSVIKWEEQCLLALKLVWGIKWAWNSERTWCPDLLTEGFW